MYEEGKGGPANRRAEIWLKSREWLEDDAGASIPDLDSLQADACGPGYRYDSHSRLLIEAKDDMRKRGIPSPDEWDAVALTFAEPVFEQGRHTRNRNYVAPDLNPFASFQTEGGSSGRSHSDAF